MSASAAAAAPTPSPATAKAMRTATASAAAPARSSAAGPGSAWSKRCTTGAVATAGCRPPTTGHARTHAGAAAKRSHDYRPENGPHRRPSPICTAAGRRPVPTPSSAPQRPATMPLLRRPLALRLVICERGRRRSPHTPRPFVSVAATRPSAPGDCRARGATRTCACKPPRIGSPASTSTTLATAAKEGRRRSRTAERADMRTFGVATRGRTL